MYVISRLETGYLALSYSKTMNPIGCNNTLPTLKKVMDKKCFQEVAGFNDRWIVLIGLPISSLLVSLMLFNDYYANGNWAFLSVCIPMSFVYTSVFWISLRWTYIKVRGRYPRFEQIGRRLAWIGLSFLLTFFGVNFILDKFFKLIIPSHDAEVSLVMEFIASMLLSALVIAIYEALSFYIQLQTTIAEKATLERQNVESQLEGLRNQVNPHFLFNSLNTLIYLIPEDANKAVRFVQQLSKVYRYVLESRDDKIIPLSVEMDFLKAYIFLLKERFGDNLQVNLHDLKGSADRPIVPLTLQMLFENAIKHNVISSEKPLFIEVFTENGHLVVRNKLQRKNQVMDSTGVGIDNIRARYKMLCDKDVEVIVSRDYYTVVLPLMIRTEELATARVERQLGY